MAESAQSNAYPDLPGPYWHRMLEEAESHFKKWRERADKVVKRYRDERDYSQSQRRKFNILWSNFQVLKPALYGRPAKPEVQRRHNDEDPTGRTASMMLERVLGYEVEHYPDFDQAMSGSVEDRLLPGRGIAWVRYEPKIVQMQGEQPAEITEDEQAPTNERVTGARSPCDYVHWQDFLHSPARVWEEVWWVARYVYLTKDEGVKRFGEAFLNVPIEYDSNETATQGKAKKDNQDKKAKVAEIWDKRTGRVCWVAKGYTHALDERDDPLGLEEFFPCPKPIYATVTTDSLIPIPDYCEYQDQAEELDLLTQRISMLTKAVKANGVYNAEFKSIKRLLNEGIDNTLEPVDQWGSFSEKGGLPGALALMDTSPIIQALEQLYISREQVKQTIYEITGISDIIRGATDAKETLGAQQLKANFGSLRMRSGQQDIARFASDLFRIKAQLICKFYPPEVIREMSGIAQTLDGQNEQVVQEALALLKNSTLRDWRINVEADSLAQLDEQADKQSRIECVTAFGTLMEKAMPMMQMSPGMVPLVGEVAQFLMRGFKVGRTLEAAIEQAVKAATAQAQQPPKPDPKVQAEQIKAGAVQMKAQAEAQVTPMKVQAEMARAQADVMTAHADVQGKVIDLAAQRQAAMQPQTP